MPRSNRSIDELGPRPHRAERYPIQKVSLNDLQRVAGALLRRWSPRIADGTTCGYRFEVGRRYADRCRPQPRDGRLSARLLHPDEADRRRRAARVPRLVVSPPPGATCHGTVHLAAVSAVLGSRRDAHRRDVAVFNGPARAAPRPEPTRSRFSIATRACRLVFSRATRRPHRSSPMPAPDDPTPQRRVCPKPGWPARLTASIEGRWWMSLVRLCPAPCSRWAPRPVLGGDAAFTRHARRPGDCWLDLPGRYPAYVCLSRPDVHAYYAFRSVTERPSGTARSSSCVSCAESSSSRLADQGAGRWPG